MTDIQLAALPRRVRPSAAETAERYVHRLAEANHLRPSYLRLLLTTPPHSLGPIQLDKLAALSGRDPAVLVRALPELAPRIRIPGRAREIEARKARNEQRKRERFAAIRYDARLGMSVRALATKHHVSRRTVGKALQSEIPPPRKKIERQPTVLLGLREHIDAMLEANPAITAAAIWQRLHDEHDATPSYPAVRTYITTRRTTRPQTPKIIDEPPPAPPSTQADNAPPAAVTEEAIVQLLQLAFFEIQSLTAATHDDQSAEVVNQRRESANEIAGICQDLTAWLAPHRRDSLAEGLRHRWRSASTRQRRWLQSRLDQLGYDHHWLTDLAPEPATAGREHELDATAPRRRSANIASWN